MVPFEVIKQIQILTPLTSSSKLVEFKPTKLHIRAFDEIKTLLLKEPLFCNLIKENATKYLWVDAASSSSCLGAVLAQQINPNECDKPLPTFIDLEDPIHRLIYDNSFPYQPCQVFTKLPINMPKPSDLKTTPPHIKKESKLYGYTSENVHESLFWSIISIYAVYNCKLPDSTLILRKMAVSIVKEGILGIKMKDKQFNNNGFAYRTFLDEFSKGQHNIDPNWYLVEALAKATFRCFIFLSSLVEHKDKPIFKINHESTKPPLIFGVYRQDNHIIFTPYFYNKNLEFNIGALKNKIEIVAYLAKSVPDNYKSRSILDLEVFAILTALHSLQRYISNTKCHLLTDSRVLYYLFHQKVGDSSTKIRRWVLKLLSDYPLISLHFIRTTDNLADYLTRQGLPRGDLEKLSLKNMEIKDFYDDLPKHDFTLVEWVKFCADNPHYLTIAEPTNTITMSISRGISNLNDLIDPINVLKDRLTREEFCSHQQREFKKVIQKCIESNNFEFTDTDAKQYRLINGLLLIFHDNQWKIELPNSLVGLVLAYTHLLGHWGTEKTLKNLTIYHFEHMYTKTKRFVNSCYSCFLQNSSSRKNKLGMYPIPEYPFQEISMDLCENLNKVGGFSHLLIIQDVLSEYISIFPLKSKTSTEMSRVFQHGFLQHFQVSRIHTDNGPVFRNSSWLSLMATLNIKIIDSSAQNPQARGKAERAVGMVKTLLKKLLATSSSNSLNWDTLPFLISKIMNNTVVPRTGYSPNVMIFGNKVLNPSFLNLDPLFPVHHSITNNKTSIETLTKNLSDMSKIVHDSLQSLKQESIDYKNTNRIDKQFSKNDIVFVIDRYNIPGNSRPLKTKFYPSPCVVIKPLFTTTLIQRIADGFKALYSNDHLKRFKEIDPTYLSLPPQIQKVLVNDFQDFLDDDFRIITEYDPFSLAQILDSVNVDNRDTVDPSFSPRRGEGGLSAPVLDTTVNDDDDLDNDEDILPDENLLPVPSSDTQQLRAITPPFPSEQTSEQTLSPIEEADELELQVPSEPSDSEDETKRLRSGKPY